VLVYDAHLAVLLAVVGRRPISASQAIPNCLGLSTVGGGFARTGQCPQRKSIGSDPGWNRDGRLAGGQFGVWNFDDQVSRLQAWRFHRVPRRAAVSNYVTSRASSRGRALRAEVRLIIDVRSSFGGNIFQGNLPQLFPASMSKWGNFCGCALCWWPVPSRKRRDLPPPIFHVASVPMA
jgi:hypothetical protein